MDFTDDDGRRLIATILISSTIITLILVARVIIKAHAKRCTERRPEFGPYREKHASCRDASANGSCSKRKT